MPPSIMPQSSARSVETEESDMTSRTTNPSSLDFAKLHHLSEKSKGLTRDVESSLSLLDLSHLNTKALTRKIDFRIMPMIIVLYMFSFLDRGETRHSKHSSRF